MTDFAQLSVFSRSLSKKKKKKNLLPVKFLQIRPIKFVKIKYIFANFSTHRARKLKLSSVGDCQNWDVGKGLANTC